MALSVLGIACSPRRKGNTTRLLLEAMKTAQDEGQTTEIVYLSDLSIIDVFKCAERSIQTFFHMLDIRYAQPCLYRGVDHAGEINDHPTAFDDVRKATQALIT